MTIEQANLLTLRPAMNVIVSVRETADVPSNLTATNILTDYEINAKATADGEQVILMDLCNGGFVADGKAQPISELPLLSSQKYGYISSELADASGNFANPVSLTIESDYEWEYMHFQLSDSKGNITYYDAGDITWTAGTTTITFSSFTPNERLYILEISLGKSFILNKDDLVNLNINIRGINENLEQGTFELAMSEAEVEAYMGDNADTFLSVYERMEKLSPCHIQIGYADDSIDRTFYISDSAEYDSASKTLKIKMADATILLDSITGGKYELATASNMKQKYYDAIKELLTSAGIVPYESGTVPTDSGTNASNILIKNDSARNIIAQAVGLNRDAERFAITYRDGGVPELIAGQSPMTYELNEADVADFKREAEMRVKEYDGMLESFSTGGTAEEIAKVENATANTTYIVETSDPIASITSATSGCTATLLSPYKIQVVTTTSGDKAVNGYKVAIAQENGTAETGRRGVITNLNELPKLEYGVASSILPTGYTHCEYITSNGTQKLDTGIVLSASTRLWMDYNFTNVSTQQQRIMSCEPPIQAYVYINQSDNYAYWNGTGKQSTAKKANIKRTQIDYDCITKKIKFTGGISYSGTFTLSGTATNNLMLLGDSISTHLSKANLYAFKVWEDGELVIDAIPCYDTNGDGYMYNKVDGSFFGDALGGHFTHGADSTPITYYSLTEQNMTDLLERDNAIYSFKWRGNPKWQTLDHIRMTMLNGDELEMTIEEITLDMSDGGLVSEIKARGGIF